MKIALMKVIEVPDGDSCKYPPTEPITRSSYCVYLHFELWNKPQKKKILRCKLFKKDLDVISGAPQKCDKCKQS